MAVHEVAPIRRSLLGGRSVRSDLDEAQSYLDPESKGVHASGSWILANDDSLATDQKESGGQGWHPAFRATALGKQQKNPVRKRRNGLMHSTKRWMSWKEVI